jgi:hypothetical protein
MAGRRAPWVYSDPSHEFESNYPGNCTIREQREGYKCETESERSELKGGKTEQDILSRTSAPGEELLLIRLAFV